MANDSAEKGENNKVKILSPGSIQADFQSIGLGLLQCQ